MPLGKVKWFDTEKGVGELSPDSEDGDLPLTASAIVCPIDRIAEGARVSFDLTMEQRGVRVINVVAD
ncbi:cold-shock protein [Streptomyces sp. NPDC054901]